MKLTLLPKAFSVCKLRVMPELCRFDGFFALAGTGSEISLVCEEAKTPEEAVLTESGWRALEVAGPLVFGLTGILAGISSALAKAGVSIFAVSTYDTDYVLVKEEKLEKAAAALSGAGYEIAGFAKNA